MTMPLSRQIADAVKSMRGMKAEDMFDDVHRKFPQASSAEVDRGFDIACDELEQEGRDHLKGADALTQAAKLLDGMPAGTKFADAVRVKAENGDPLAVALRDHANSIESRIHEALFEKAIDLHPDWERSKPGRFRWIGATSCPITLDQTNLVDWLQTNHPSVAREIERSISA